MSDFQLYLYLLLAIVVAIVVIKKVTGCIFRLIFTIALVVIVAAIYFLYIMPSA